MNVIYYELPDYGDDFLMHHGIKGMKWGIRRTAEQLGHFTKRVYKTGKKFRDDRIADAKDRAISTGDYNKIKKYQHIMTDDELKRAKSRMETNKQLNELRDSQPLNKRDQRKVDKAVRKGDFKSLMKLEKKMSNADFKAAYDRLDTRRKLKELNNKSVIETGVKALETIGRVGTAVATIGKASRDIAENKQKRLEAKNKSIEALDPSRKGFMAKANGQAQKEAEKILSDESQGTMKERVKKASRVYNEIENAAKKRYSSDSDALSGYTKLASKIGQKLSSTNDALGQDDEYIWEYFNKKKKGKG